MGYPIAGEHLPIVDDRSRSPPRTNDSIVAIARPSWRWPDGTC